MNNKKLSFPQIIILTNLLFSLTYLAVIKFFKIEGVGLVIASVIVLTLAILVIAGGIWISYRNK